MMALVFLVLLNMNTGATMHDVQIDQCTNASYIESNGLQYGLTLANGCVENNVTDKSVEVDWVEPVNLTLGPIRSNEVKTGDNWFYVDSNVRPDLDVPAVLTFKNHGFVTEPTVLRNGGECSSCQIEGFDQRAVAVKVEGFSNYSLTAAKDFTVYSDPEPELKDKTYQTIDLGAGNNSRRAINYSCIVQVFGKNQNQDWILVQTNPTRDVQARMFGSPDLNQPESLGYFPTVNGIANTYFRGDSLSGYNNFQLVIQCASPTSKLVYEEPINTKYSPAGRGLVGRGLWLVDGNNATYVMLYFFGGLIVLWIVVMIFRRTFRRY